MFEIAKVDPSIDKTEFKKEKPNLRTELLDVQFDSIECRKFPVILIFAGMEGTGVVDTIANANTVLDTRHVVTFAHRPPTEEEAERPRMWRYWRILPPKGEIGIYTGGWYAGPLTERITRRTGKADFEEELDNIKRFETMLAAEGAMILKFWLHIDKDEQKKRLRKMHKDQRTKWRVEESLWGGSRNYQRVKRAAEQMLRITGTETAPWIPVDTSNPYYRSLVIAKTVCNAIRMRLEHPEPVLAILPAAPGKKPGAERKSPLSTLDLSLSLEKKDYEKQLERYQDRLNKLVWSKAFCKRSLVLVFEGNDAAGKGGAIRRVTEFLDPRLYRVNQFAAPTDEEKAQPYLWRFWRRLPRRQHVAIFDRSWYGRVLVERVEGFCSEANWQRAYGEINDFEAEMADAGSIVIKFWLAIDKDEQEARFKAREVTGYKRYKITEEDWRNREKWDEYTDAVCDMIDRTSTAAAPWVLVEANNKLYSRIKVLKTICKQIESALKKS
jgi:polyphosphate:AMP phosphotransferase